MSSVLAFLASGIVVVLAGTAVARYADAIAEATKLGRLWIGSVLLAGATSLLELATDISAVRLGATGLAVGRPLRLEPANMLILVVIDLLPPRKQVLQQVAFDGSDGQRRAEGDGDDENAPRWSTALDVLAGEQLPRVC